MTAILLAGTLYRVADELASRYGSVEIAGVVGSLSETVTRAAAHDGASAVGIVAIAADLRSPLDLAAGLDLAGAIDRLLALPSPPRIAVVADEGDTIGDTFALRGVLVLPAGRPTDVALGLARAFDLRRRDEMGRIVAVTGLQGGAGRTYVATRLAAAFAERGSRDKRPPTLLAELDLRHPTLAYDEALRLLHDEGRRSLSAVLGYPLSDDEPDLARAIVTRERSGLPFDALLAPMGIYETLSLYTGHADLVALRGLIGRILDMVVREYGVVVADTGTDLFTDPAPIEAISRAAAIVIVASPGPRGYASVLDMRAILDDLGLLPRAHLVLNAVGRDTASRSYESLIREALADRALPIALRVEQGQGRVDWAGLATTLLGAEERPSGR